jgi:uncharacterized membrane protein
MDLPSAEHLVVEIVAWIKLSVELLGALVIAIGISIAAVGFVRALASGSSAGFIAVRLGFARYLVLALELQLAADILSTAIAPSWEAIGKLAAIAVIRSALNWYLMHELNSLSTNDVQLPSLPAVTLPKEPPANP